ncbi:MAG TPA: cytidylate kinase-like family protein [Bryobacterales bacterium]|jgi:cytidylate kinase|nr:cytidylate kinase-like family protein [Bryobacterales bacterium]
MIRVITISREYGSGGGAVARMLAERLKWKLVDDALITEIAKKAQVNPAIARRYDECVDPWFHRLMKALWQGGFVGAASRVEGELFDAETMARLWSRVIEETGAMGDCVIVGRGGQCILQNREDAFHVSIYAPLEERVRRLREQLPPEADPEAAAIESDRRRAAYIRRYFGQDWTNRHLYDLAVCSSIGLERVVETILCAAGLKA